MDSCKTRSSLVVPNQSYDVVILGAGVAGCATALSLIQLERDLKILIIERKSKENKIKDTEVRVGETLPPQTAGRLTELGLWKNFQKSNFQRSYGTSALWGTDEIYHNEFIASPYGYGWHIDRDKFDQLLIDHTIKLGVDIIFETSLIAFDKVEGNNWQIKLKASAQENTVSCKIMVDGTGKKASIATKLGAKKLKSDRLIGIIRAYDSSNNLLAGSGAMVESVHNGWWYSSVLNDETSILCFMTDADISKSECLADMKKFEEQLNQTKYTKQRVGNSKSSLQIKAAHTQILDHVTGDGWIAVGDSASSYDPLSALGVFKSLNMSKYASFAILDYLKGNKKGLSRYDRIIKKDFDSFLKKKDDYYGEEGRFPDSQFWIRRNKKNQELVMKSEIFKESNP